MSGPRRWRRAAMGEPPEPVLIDRTLGTNIGTMTKGGGLAAAFDGVEFQTSSAGANTFANGGWVGKQYAAPKLITRAKYFGPTDVGPSSTTTDIRIYGRTGSAPANGADGTLLAQVTGVPSTATSYSYTFDFTAVSHDYVWVLIVRDSGSSGIYCSEFQIWELA